MTNSKSDKNYI